MSKPLFPNADSAHNLQVRNNAIFDDIPSAKPPSWLHLQPNSCNLPLSLDATVGNENLSPIPSTKLRPLFDTSYPHRQSQVHFHLPDEEGSIDVEIVRLEELRTKKYESAAAAGARRRWVVPARFMEPKQSTSTWKDTFTDRCPYSPIATTWIIKCLAHVGTAY